MALVTGYTAEKMNEFNNASVVGGAVNPTGALILKTRGGTDIDAGNVKGLKGDTGNTGAAGLNGISGGTTTARNAAFPLPSTVAAQAALANKVVTWYNVTTEMFETYYAKTGTTGLTVPGVTGTSGWYENLYLSNMAKGEVGHKYTVGSTGQIQSDNANWYMPDFIDVDLVAGRRYRMKYKLTHWATTGNMALALETHYELASAATNTPRTGTAIEDQWTLYIAPGASQGKTDVLEWFIPALPTGRYRLKISVLRATLSGTWQFERRRLQIFDEGLATN